MVTAAGLWDFTFTNSPDVANARVTFVWKKYAKVNQNGVIYKVRNRHDEWWTYLFSLLWLCWG